MVLRCTTRVRLIALSLMLGACSDTPPKHAPDAATAIEAGHDGERDAGGQAGHHAGGAFDAGTRDAGAMPMQPHVDAGLTSDASAPKPAHDAATPRDDDDAGAGMSNCDE